MGTLAVLSQTEIDRRTTLAAGRLTHCDLCPRYCGVDRIAGKLGVCGIGRFARVASYGPHFGEEDVLVGHDRRWRATAARHDRRSCAGSGTIFFSGCNLLCSFCQNSDISHAAVGSEVTAEFLASMMLELQSQGCCNINLVTPSHVVAQIVEALAVARRRGLNVPLVYNSSGFDSVSTLGLLDGVIDIYMPDVKFHRDEGAAYLHEAADYGQVAQSAVREMHRQVGDLKISDGVAVRGLLVRHLVMPNEAANSAGIFRFLAELSPETYVNVMSQYRPLHLARRDPVIGVLLSPEEHVEAVRAAHRAGLRRIVT